MNMKMAFVLTAVFLNQLAHAEDQIWDTYLYTCTVKDEDIKNGSAATAASTDGVVSRYLQKTTVTSGLSKDTKDIREAIKSMEEQASKQLTEEAKAREKFRNEVPITPTVDNHLPGTEDSAGTGPGAPKLNPFDLEKFKKCANSSLSLIKSTLKLLQLENSNVSGDPSSVSLGFLATLDETRSDGIQKSPLGVICGDSLGPYGIQNIVTDSVQNKLIFDTKILQSLLSAKSEVHFRQLLLVATNAYHPKAVAEHRWFWQAIWADQSINIVFKSGEEIKDWGPYLINLLGIGKSTQHPNDQITITIENTFDVSQALEIVKRGEEFYESLKI